MLKIVNKIFSFKKIKFTPYKKVDLIFLEDNAINLRFNNLSCKVLDYKEINLYHLFVSVLSSLIRFKFSLVLPTFSPFNKRSTLHTLHACLDIENKFKFVSFELSSPHWTNCLIMKKRVK